MIPYLINLMVSVQGAVIPHLNSPVVLCCVHVTLFSAVESVREAVGRRVKLILRRSVQLEVKGDKVENRVLVSGCCVLASVFKRFNNQD